jgi:hypothetical protein
MPGFDAVIFYSVWRAEKFQILRKEVGRRR